MPKAFLSFKLPEEESDFRKASTASKLHCALHDFENEVLRKYRKYHEFKTKEARAVFEDIDKRFFECLEEWGVELD